MQKTAFVTGPRAEVEQGVVQGQATGQHLWIPIHLGKLIMKEQWQPSNVGSFG
jgi:hypothetical protein